MGKIRMYHYTNENRLNSIKAAKMIKASQLIDGGKDAMLGTGVYLTVLDPDSHTIGQIAKNNWNVCYPAVLARCKYAIELMIPEEELTKGEKHEVGNRDVWIKVGSIDLTKYSHKFIKAFD